MAPQAPSSGGGPDPGQGPAQEEGAVVGQGEDHAHPQGEPGAFPVAEGHGRREEDEDQVGEGKGELGVELKPRPPLLQGGQEGVLELPPGLRKAVLAEAEGVGVVGDGPGPGEVRGHLQGLPLAHHPEDPAHLGEEVGGGFQPRHLGEVHLVVAVVLEGEGLVLPGAPLGEEEGPHLPLEGGDPHPHHLLGRHVKVLEVEALALAYGDLHPLEPEEARPLGVDLVPPGHPHPVVGLRDHVLLEVEGEAAQDRPHGHEGERRPPQGDPGGKKGEVGPLGGEPAEDQDRGGHQGDGEDLDPDPGDVVGEPAEDLGEGHPLKPPRPGVEEAEEVDGGEEEEGEEEDGEALPEEVAVEDHGRRLA